MTNRSMQLAQEIFADDSFEKAKASQDSNWEREGHYLQIVERVKIDQNRSKDTALFIEKTIIHVYDNADGDGHRVGESVTHSMWQKHDSFMGNVKAMLSSLLGIKPTDVKKEDLFEILSDEQPLAGQVIEVKNRVIMTRKNTPFTKIGYRRIVPAAELLKILDPEVIKAYFPDDLLVRMAEAEAAEG